MDRIIRFYKGVALALFFILCFYVSVKANTSTYELRMYVDEIVDIKCNGVTVGHEYICIDGIGDEWTFEKECGVHKEPIYSYGTWLRVPFSDNGTIELLTDDEMLVEQIKEVK